MNEPLELSRVLAIIAPMLAIQLVLAVIALALCAKAEQTRGPKWMWILIILFLNVVGPIAFFIAGRRNEA
ncbi:PLD nuclease N-terminal domain-containing protein [Paenibacillus arenilitoris]|uniref:PLDc_N domain-containing protein n=1 Tax=Paenibacillus arenilitoris TaxID=2772299 RepID=A0A927CPW3_9BACL|nr:PLD nuclease N-terminal domain-containing protein [Paenibacillus arenilitoris]MBD2870907.1 PLDc_N domain-containing protein [Paenibacillus arenilitoris]